MFMGKWSYNVEWQISVIPLLLDRLQFCNEVQSNANEEGKGESGNCTCDGMKERESLTGG